MSGVVLSVKTCRDCGAEKPVSEFYFHGRKRDGTPMRSPYCKLCERIRVDASRARRRALMGEAELRRLQTLQVRKHRRKTGNERGKEYNRARTRAVGALIELHRDEFTRLLDREVYEARSHTKER